MTGYLLCAFVVFLVVAPAVAALRKEPSMSEEPGRVPEPLREQLRGLRATDDNDVARGEDDNPITHAGPVIEERRPEQ